jgi:serine protease Do
MKKIIIIIVAIYIFMSLLLALASKAVASENVIQDAYVSSFKIEVYTNNGKKMGSGFIVKEFSDYIITNRHVVEGGQEIVTTYIDNIKYDLEIVDISKDYDFAILKFEHNKPKINNLMGMCDNSERELQYPVYNFGHPNGVRYIMTTGVVSGEKRVLPLSNTKAKFLAINLDVLKGGQSGSAIIDARKHCVLSILTRGIVNSNLMFSIEVEALRKYISSIKIKQILSIVEK